MVWIIIMKIIGVCAIILAGVLIYKKEYMLFFLMISVSIVLMTKHLPKEQFDIHIGEYHQPQEKNISPEPKHLKYGCIFKELPYNNEIKKHK